MPSRSIFAFSLHLNREHADDERREVEGNYLKRESPQTAIMTTIARETNSSRVEKLASSSKGVSQNGYDFNDV